MGYDSDDISQDGRDKGGEHKVMDSGFQLWGCEVIWLKGLNHYNFMIIYKSVLLKFNVPDEQIAKQTRWHRIAMIRKLSSEKAASGIKVDPTTISKNARGQRMSFLQLQQQTREKCQEIWDRQVQNLSAVDGDKFESDSEANSDLDSFAGDLENLLDAEAFEDGDEGNYESRHDKVDGVKGFKMRRRPLQAQAEEEIEDEAAEAAELCRMLMDDDEAERKKKKKARTAGDEVRLTPGMKKNDIDRLGLLNKKVKILGDGLKIIREKKSARKSFVCGACGQLGHMRTNKNCPNYGEDLETQVEGSDPEKASLRANSMDHGGKTVTKKLISKASQCSDKPVTSDAETGNPKPVVKVKKIKFANKLKPGEVQVESHKPSIVIKPPVETDRDQPRKIVIKQPKEVINLDKSNQEVSPSLQNRKMKKIIDLSTFEKHSENASKRSAEEAARRKMREDKRWLEEEEKRRIAEREIEERIKRLYEQKRILEEQEREDDRMLPARDRSAKRRPVVELGRYGAEYAPPAKRRQGGEVGLSNILEIIVDTLKDRIKVSYLFLKPVSKKEAPDYLKIIKHPMDLSTIKEKVRKLEYKSREEFRHDVWQITYNAHKYNDGRNPGIPPLTDQLLELCDYLINEHGMGLTEAEDGIEYTDG
ncbi:hypothetical protein RHMOL_Rhmol10G0297100 [Rhododendron molle]|uniref:Uncharacterized protein n=1 Tax=Rhododendron molle TaxID=49168 RepID=A0ACC0M7U1_RHOML|nr:hypothetical protein RHMOL_Rhmol10G0297100 [Rhododendron molle]